MKILKVTTWNIEHMRRVFEPATNSAEQARRDRRRANIAREIKEIAPDILCIQEGPPAQQVLESFCAGDLTGDYTLVTSTSEYGQTGNQWIWFLVKRWLTSRVELQPIEVWKEFAGSSWKVHYWGDFTQENYRHPRHPQVLVLNWGGTRVEFIGTHFKSKFVNQGESDWNAGGKQRDNFIREAIKARIKLATAATNVRSYIEQRFRQEPNPAIFVLGDANDGPGKEYFEDLYLFFDLISNLQGDVFFASRFLNHGLFDYEGKLRWTVRFSDFVDPNRDPHILLDHILFTQGLVNETSPLHVTSKAGLVEHHIHDLINAGEPGYARTSDHRPVSLHVEAKEPVPVPAAMHASMTAEAITGFEALSVSSSCYGCVIDAVEEWSGHSGFSLDQPLSEIWAVNNGDTCDTGVMRMLAELIDTRCQISLNLNSSWCGRTVRVLLHQACG